MKTVMVILGVLLLVGGVAALTIGPINYEGVVAATEDPVFYNELGYMLAQEENLADAQRAFATAVELDASYENARKNLAVTAFRNEDYRTAIAQWRWLVTNHGSQEYHFDLAQSLVAHARFAETDAARAIAQLEEALTHLAAAGDWPHAAENAAIVRNVLGEF